MKEILFEILKYIAILIATICCSIFAVALWIAAKRELRKTEEPEQSETKKKRKGCPYYSCTNRSVCDNIEKCQAN